MSKIRALRNKKGFTLVELVVVIIIIAILAGALVTSLVGYINKAKETNALLEGNNVYVAAQAYISEEMGKNGDFKAAAGDAAMITQINEYLGDTVVGDGAGEITDLETGNNGTITSFDYTAKNGQAVQYTTTGGWEKAEVAAPEVPE